MTIKLVFHERYHNDQYANDPAAARGRLDGIMEQAKSNPRFYEIIEPGPAATDDILRAHTREQYDRVKQNPLRYELAALAAGGAITAAETAFEGEPSFAVVRPPGHHASAAACWGFCFFNNIAISLLRLFSEKKIKTAFVLDFDLHTGDGNINILENRNDGFIVSILNPESTERSAYIQEVEDHMGTIEDADIFAASAGFDQGLDDWGDFLYPEDYKELGRLMKKYAGELCQGKRYAVLEGGYNHQAMGQNFHAFCSGFV